MRSKLIVRIDALVFFQEANARQAEAIDRALLLRCDFAAEPGEVALRAQPCAQLAAVEIGQRLQEKIGRFIDIDDALRLGEE